MDERSKEFVAPKKWDAWQTGVFSGVIVIMLLALFLLRAIWWMVAFLFVLVLLSLYYMKNTFKAEYAYTVSSRLKTEILHSSGKRETVCDFYLEDMTAYGRYDDENKAKIKNADKVYNAAYDVKNGEETYFALFERDGKREAVLFTPNEMMLEEIKKVKS